MNSKLVRNNKKNKMAIYSNEDEDGYIGSSDPDIVEDESEFNSRSPFKNYAEIKSR